jgi:acetylornithine deacetylase/succinyl-diaminopimelate desuccinylase-like protein
MSQDERFQTEALEQLKELLRIPSISALPEHKGDIQKAADFVEAALKRAGMTETRQITRGGGNPLVFGAWTGAPGKPTMLLYGHYDVQPPDPLDEWKSAPFEPEQRGDDLFGRGTSDDKGQVWILVKAVERLMQLNGTLPVNIKFLLEGEEESGGESIEAYVAEKPAELACDAAVICDTEMFAAGLPTLTTGLRGLVYGEITVEGARQDLHSGSYGGSAPNPLMAIAEILTALKHKDGRVLIPRFYERVKAPAEAELAAWRSLPFNEKEYLEKEVGSLALTGEPGYSVLERVWGRPTFEVHGIRGGFIGEGSKTVIPARAMVKISCRLVPDQQPDEIVALIKEAVALACPKGVKAEYKLLSAAPASMVDVSSPFIQKACEALDEVFQKKTVFMRCGGSIPIAGSFREHLGVPSVLMGFGLPDDNLHSPNEKFHLPNFYRGIDSVMKYLELLGR